MSELENFAITQSRAWELSTGVILRDYFDNLYGIYRRCVTKNMVQEEQLKFDVSSEVKTCFGRRMFVHSRMWGVAFMSDTLPESFYVVEPKKPRTEWMIYNFDRVVYEKDWKIPRRDELELMFERVGQIDLREDRLNNNPSLKYRFNRIHHLFSQISRTGKIPIFGEIKYDHISLDSK